MAYSNKHGFTLIEVLVVVAIMGILSAMGVAGLQTAVENTRVQDASKNVVAFLNRVSNDANRMSTPLCLNVPSDNNRRLNVYKSADCSNLENGATPEYFMELDAPMSFSNTKPNFECEDGDYEDDWLSENKGVFKPKLGLSAAPVSGYIAVQYASVNHYAVAVKCNTENFIRAVSCDEDGCD